MNLFTHVSKIIVYSFVILIMWISIGTVATYAANFYHFVGLQVELFHQWFIFIGVYLFTLVLSLYLLFFRDEFFVSEKYKITTSWLSLCGLLLILSPILI